MRVQQTLPRCGFFVLLVAVSVLTAGQLVLADASKAGPPVGKGIVKDLVRIETKLPISFYAIAPDSKTLVYTDLDDTGVGKLPRRQLILIDLITGKELHRRPVDSAEGGVFSEDGKLLAIGISGGTTPSVWDVARWELKVALKCPKGYKGGWP